MKKSIIKITAITFFSFTGFTALAQNAVDKKAKVDVAEKSIDKGPAPSPMPSIVAPPKAMKVEVLPKPIIPGGEFKPMDTGKPITGIKPEAAEKVPPAVAPEKQGNG